MLLLTPDLDSNQVGYQAAESTRFSLEVESNIPLTELRRFELLVNGSVVSSGSVQNSFNLNFILPDRESGADTATAQLRLFTPSETVVLTEVITLDLVADPTPFAIADVDLPDGATRGSSLASIDVRFSKRPDPNDLTPAFLMILDEANQPVELTNISSVTSDLLQDTVRLEFDTLPEGEHRLVVKGTATDRSTRKSRSSAIQRSTAWTFDPASSVSEATSMSTANSRCLAVKSADLVSSGLT